MPKTKLSKKITKRSYKKVSKNVKRKLVNNRKNKQNGGYVWLNDFPYEYNDRRSGFIKLIGENTPDIFIALGEDNPELFKNNQGFNIDGKQIIKSALVRITDLNNNFQKSIKKQILINGVVRGFIMDGQNKGLLILEKKDSSTLLPPPPTAFSGQKSPANNIRDSGKGPSPPSSPLELNKKGNHAVVASWGQAPQPPKNTNN
jgi:hypothetical protein